MKTKIFKLAFFIFLFVFFVGCSTKKDTILSRNYHALTTRDNVLFNGQLALDKGVMNIKTNQKDNFWKRLPVEKMEIKEDNSENENSKNPDFEVAEAKAAKAVQKHSMNIAGQEKNYQIDEAYLLLGKSRYYDQRFFPALEAFNYILYKYPTSSNIQQAKIWREKTNLRLGNDEQVIKNISKLLEEKGFKQAKTTKETTNISLEKDGKIVNNNSKRSKGKKINKQVIADANALLAESFLNLEQKDSAIVKLKIAENYTKNNAEKGRYRFIIGQLYQELGIKDTALIYYQSVIDMNRKIDRVFLIQAHAKRAQLFDYENDDKEEFVIKYDKLIADRENRPFKGFLFYEMGVFYDKNNDQELAKKFYNASLKSNSTDNYLIASNYRNLGDMYFKNTDFFMAAKYYDSTLVKLDVKTREYIHIKKVRKDLDEVIEFETIAKVNDSILNVVAMSDNDKVLYYEAYIAKLKKAEEEKKLLEEKQKQIQKNIDANNQFSSDDDPNSGMQQGRQTPSKNSLAPPAVKGISPKSSANVFYFYNPSTVALGKVEFKKKFGNRDLTGNWKLPTIKTNTEIADAIENISGSGDQNPEKQAIESTPPEYTTAFYIEKLPKTQVEIDSIAKERNFVYYQLGVIYKEKFKEYKLASQKLEKLLKQNPEEKLVLPTLYNLYKIYQIIDVAKAEEIKSRISSQYPDSRYAQIINNKTPNTATDSETAELEYNKWYKLYQEEQFVPVLEEIECLISQYYGDEIVPKYELLKANIIGKLNGLESYKKAMQFVADNYASSEEGKNAKEILTTQIPLLETKNFAKRESKNWKVLYKVSKDDEKTLKNIEEKFKKFTTGENFMRLTLIYDVFTEKENFIVIQGMKSEAYAQSVASILKEDKNFKITEPAIIISSENYKIVQIKKNLSEYLAFIKPAPVEQQAAPTQVVPQPNITNDGSKTTPVIKESPQENIPQKDNINEVPTPKK